MEKRVGTVSKILTQKDARTFAVRSFIKSDMYRSRKQAVIDGNDEAK
jgi:hypothetical protein